MILWYDAKMKNYLSLLAYVNKKRLSQANLQSFLVVDRPEYAENVDKIREGATDDRLKAQVQVLLKRDLTDQESLM